MAPAASESAPDCAPQPSAAPAVHAPWRRIAPQGAEHSGHQVHAAADMADILGVSGEPGLYEEYRCCLANLEDLITGGVAPRKKALTELATRLETNMAAVQAAAAAVQSENDIEAASTNQRLERSARQKLMLLQHDLSTCLLDIDAIESFGDEVASHSGLALLEKESALLEKGRRLALTPVPSISPVPTDDLPREAALRAVQLQRLQQLERAVEQRDELVAELSSARDSMHETCRGLQTRSQEEMERWRRVCDGTQQELAEASTEVDRLQKQVSSLQQHTENLRGCTLSMRAELFAARNEAALTQEELHKAQMHNQELAEYGAALRTRLEQLEMREQLREQRGRGISVSTY